ncbi:response regulator [Pelagicoccus sp. SDUM812003]|uniref:response regulator n=1 Tax=Pelagicoccus sp. SDUM812003 TaxID=3041267 RepID=UPI00280D26CA|nr:response regulator [Pelagicoccus sp. SDUM812003]MDQ8204177.1 response regulator [Pelagicoccus sp. SDUM812003]
MQRANFEVANRAGPIVMVDDSETDLDIARRFYEFCDLENDFVTLSSGDDLLDHLGAVERGDAPFPMLVLLDVNMPGMDGFETLSRIRKAEAFREAPTILMLTNSDNPRDIERAGELGANGYQPKHFELKKYVDFFNSLAPEN